MAAKQTRGVGIEKATPKEGRAILDAAAKRALKMTGDEFVAKWDSGGFNGNSDAPEVARVAMLLPFARS